MALKELFNHLILASTGGGGAGGPAIEVDPITRSVVEKTQVISEKQQQQQSQNTHSKKSTTTTTTTRTRRRRSADNHQWQLDCKYTLGEIQQHNSLDDCWVVIFDKVYNITDFVYEHPGGDFILLEYAGRDATHPFLSSRHGSSAYKMLDKYWIGILVDEELYYSNNSSYCSVYSNLSWRSTPQDDDEGEEDDDDADDDDGVEDEEKGHSDDQQQQQQQQQDVDVVVVSQVDVQGENQEEEEEEDDDDDDSSSTSSDTTTNTTISTNSATSTSSSTSSIDSNNSAATTSTIDLDQQLQLQYFRTLFSFDTT